MKIAGRERCGRAAGCGDARHDQEDDGAWRRCRRRTGRRDEVGILDADYAAAGATQRQSRSNTGGCRAGRRTDQDRTNVISYGRSIAFQMAEVAINPANVQEILRLIAELLPKPPPAPA